jgi:SNF family Na+-dependent transporter
MNIYFKCQNCNQENRLKTNAKTRVEFAMKNGNSIKSNCNLCKRENTLKVNKIYAKKSKSIFLISGLIFLIGSAFGTYYLVKMISEMKTIIGIAIIASGLLVPIWIYNIINQEERNRVNSFNRTYVTE